MEFETLVRLGRILSNPFMIRMAVSILLLIVSLLDVMFSQRVELKVRTVHPEDVSN